jgi:hypothetical protein
MDLPGGHGYAACVVSRGGQVLLSGALADGTTIKAASSMSQNGNAAIYVPLNGGQGVLEGWIGFRDNGASDLVGWCIWMKPAVSGAKAYSGGFNATASVFGSWYVPPSAGGTILDSPENILFSGGGLEEELSEKITLGLKNKVAGLTGNRLKLAFTLSTGAFKGSVVNPATSKLIPFGGAVFQKQNEGYGYFLDGGFSGDVYLGRQ